MRVTKPKELKAVIELDEAKRYEHFAKRVVDEEQAWGLWRDGWAMMKTENGPNAFLLWPAREYAEQCMSGSWTDHEPRAISLADLLGALLPCWVEQGVLPAVFPTPHSKGLTTTAGELIASLRKELQSYDV